MSSSEVLKELGGDQKSVKVAMAEFDIEVVSKVGTAFWSARYDVGG